MNVKIKIIQPLINSLNSNYNNVNAFNKYLQWYLVYLFEYFLKISLQKFSLHKNGNFSNGIM